MDQLTSLMEWHRTGRLASYVRATRSAGDAIGVIEAAQPPGDMSDPPTTDLTLVVALSGNLRQSSDFGAGRFRDVAPRGSMFLIPPGVSTEIHVDNSHVIRCFAMSSLRYQPHLNELRGSSSPFDFGRLHRGHFDAPQISNSLDRLWAVTENDSPAGRLFAEGVALSVLAELAMLADRPIGELTVGHLAPWQTSRITEYLESHIADDTSLSELASLVGLTPFHFCRAFKLSTGMPPHRWRSARRIERAREMLEATNLSITEIAAAVGYAEPSPFAAAFRKVYGVSPTMFRKSRRS